MTAGGKLSAPLPRRFEGGRGLGAHFARTARVVVAVGVTLTTARALFASPSARLVYSRTVEAASCPDESVLHKAVSARFGYDPFFQWAPVTLLVLVSRERGLFTARVQIVDEKGLARGVREITSDGEGCSELFDATALAISIALDAPPGVPAPAPSGAAGASSANRSATTIAPTNGGQAGSATTPTNGGQAGSATTPSNAGQAGSATTPSNLGMRPSGPAPTGSSAGSPTMSFAAPPPSRERPAGPAGTQYALGAGALVGVGLTPSPSPGVLAFVETRSRIVAPFTLGLEPTLQLTVPSDIEVAGHTAGRVQVLLVGASLLPCFRRAFLFGCGIAQVGALRAWRTEVEPSRSETTWYAGVGGRLGVDLPLSGRLFVRLQADLLVNLRPATFALDFGDSWTAQSFAGMVGAGLGTQLP